ncbi:MerR family DNA-binding protein [Lentzea sp. BCCO 10_0061]|uniref:Mercuric resistance operon regulatory protein n=1 Tax=Lentzea sokolovensis TaxID=3095429 RepID=A0ABU4US44_9PSEU|nr:MerR family transcriptional regulator [Lentzea sp. BCCO 10_0061]MDX8141530.1 MerR family DNA-binding protein [Lentzea sp. BCCO 10_0061]
MRSGEVATHAGVNLQTLRYYERRGLVEDPPRSASGYRSYPAETVDIVRFVKRAQGLGFTLDAVAELLHLASGGPEGCDAALTLAQTRKTELDRRIDDLTRMRDSLAELVATCDRPRTDRQCPLLQSLHIDRDESR